MLGFNVFLHFFAELQLHPVFDALLPVPVSLSLDATLKYGLRWFRWFKVSLSVGSKFIERCTPSDDKSNHGLLWLNPSVRHLRIFCRTPGECSLGNCIVETVTNHCKKIPGHAISNFRKLLKEAPDMATNCEEPQYHVISACWLMKLVCQNAQPTARHKFNNHS